MKYYLSAFILTLFFVIPWMAYNYPQDIYNFTQALSDKLTEVSAIIMHNPKTVAGLQSSYNAGTFVGSPKIRILLVPGHEPNFGGAEFNGIKERDLAVELANDLAGFLAEDPHFQIFITRDEHSWNEIFKQYFDNSRNSIIAWQKSHKEEMADLMRIGKIKPSAPTVFHTDAPQEVAMRLYGIDKWSNENNIDIMLHIHFNDYPGHGADQGKYNGFAIYVPEKTYYNSTTTSALAETVFDRLAKYNPVSDLPGERGGIVPDQDLIAVGSYNSVDAASMLIEYGYIYEPQFSDPAVKDMAIKDLAYQTYLGLRDFFDPTSPIIFARAYDTLILPHNWQEYIDAKNASSTEIYALQTAFMSKGVYPPPDRNINDCPRTGKLGACTKQSLDIFQKTQDILDEKDRVGPKTIRALNREFGMKVI